MVVAIDAQSWKELAGGPGGGAGSREDQEGRVPRGGPEVGGQGLGPQVPLTRKRPAPAQPGGGRWATGWLSALQEKVGAGRREPAVSLAQKL